MLNYSIPCTKSINPNKHYKKKFTLFTNVPKNKSRSQCNKYYNELTFLVTFKEMNRYNRNTEPCRSTSPDLYIFQKKYIQQS